jgi:hypothetical protein
MKPQNLLALLVALTLASRIEAQTIRIVTADASSSTNGKYGSEGTRILKSLSPDIALLQEFNVGNNGSNIATYVSDTFGPGFSYFRGSAVGIPTAIVSRYPILSSGEWDDVQLSNRDFSWSCIDIPGPKNLWVVSAHFSSVSTARASEASALTALIQANIPVADYLVVGGNFNSDSRGESQFTSLGTVVNTAGPYPSDETANENTNNARTKPYDSLFANAAFNSLQVPVTLGGVTKSNGLIFDTRVFSGLANAGPALPADATALNHVPVVKDFVIPQEAFTITAASFSRNIPAHGSITFSSAANITYRIEASSTLLANSWTVIGTVSATGPSTEVVLVAANPVPGQIADPGLATNSKRFYRVVRP